MRVEGIIEMENNEIDFYLFELILVWIRKELLFRKLKLFESMFFFFKLW